MIKKFLKSNVMLAVLFVYCLPLSVFMMYKYKKWSDVWKIVLGGFGVAFVSFMLLGWYFSSIDHKNNTVINKKSSVVDSDGVEKTDKKDKYASNEKKNDTKSDNVKSKKSNTKKGTAYKVVELDEDKQSKLDVSSKNWEKEILRISKMNVPNDSKMMYVRELSRSHIKYDDIANQYTLDEIKFFTSAEYRTADDYEMLYNYYKAHYVRDYKQPKNRTLHYKLIRNIDILIYKTYTKDYYEDELAMYEQDIVDILEEVKRINTDGQH